MDTNKRQQPTLYAGIRANKKWNFSVFFNNKSLIWVDWALKGNYYKEYTFLCGSIDSYLSTVFNN